MDERKRAANESGEQTDAGKVTRTQSGTEVDEFIEDSEFNSTFHLVMELERERNLSEDDILKPGCSDVIEVVCTLIDAAVTQIGEQVLYFSLYLYVFQWNCFSTWIIIQVCVCEMGIVM